ncbi:cellulose biosynthesis cyclic di-GMP-binding regulatory protein BcsB [Paraburkholderia sp. UYCP14C]|uniref:cellulose biosynthesis cyclic di-GMP-binding regulatory protein BcsB n=1 Tax=Paraburkholderia sp. UYCP14C TaxID=2511130 RepID=UPI00101EE55B|nr:cellulose biosynthesis cyclic di-GMP-binding regulatory protein BcsB [Paraburkholderia sp. UYCP14C]RZF31453.1 cellulose biosynthesis cyclic di-GMP-binding regulatory protein BcsB [Paraburkholderia sp. UYCP14C]
MKPVVSLCLSLTAVVGALYAAVSGAAPSMPVAVAAANAPAASTIVSASAANANANYVDNDAIPTPASGSSASRVSFATLGAYQPLTLRGVEDARTVNLGVRLDRVVTAARLRLRYTYSPSLVFAMSHLKVSVNNEVVATVPFDREHAGKLVTQDIALDPRFLTDYNQIGLRLIAHYTLEHCEDPENSALWADVSPSSEFIVDTAPIRLPDDLALLPAPFFDHRDASRLRLPFVLPAAADNATLRSAGVLASWFGAQADYRQARFPALSTLPTDSHAVVVARSEQLPAGLTLPPVNGPMLIVADNPVAPNRKLLIVTGRSAAEVDEASTALVLGTTALAGPAVRITQLAAGAPRKPYDAPRWLPVDRPVAFKELIDDPSQLQVRGSAPDAIRLNLRVPADLYSWNGAGVPLSLKYRYTAPTVQNNSALAVQINDQLVKSYRLALASADDAQGRLQLPVLSNNGNRATSALDIPAFRVGSSNQLQLRFNLDSQKTGLCQGVATNPVQAAVDPDSTIDFSDFVHFAQMPNLAFFANSGFPFTRYADLSQTAVVIPEHPAPQELESLLTMLGHMGQWTGYPALRVQVARPRELAQLSGKDLLVIGGNGSAPWLARWPHALPLTIGAQSGDAAASGAAAPGTAASGPLARAAFAVDEQWRGGARRNDAHRSDGGARIERDGPLAALMGFELPGSHGRSVVALSATDQQQLSQLLDMLEKPDRVAQLQGDVALLRDGKVDSMRVGDTYLVGYVPWYARLWSKAIQHPVLLGVLGALAGLALAIGAFTALQELAARRRGV